MSIIPIHNKNVNVMGLGLPPIKDICFTHNGYVYIHFTNGTVTKYSYKYIKTMSESESKNDIKRTLQE